MCGTDKLAMLKVDLQMLTDANDGYLEMLLNVAKEAMTREGITDDESADYAACQISYAAYLFRKRAASTSGSGEFAVSGGETAMPRFLRYMLNNLVISQKIGGDRE